VTDAGEATMILRALFWISVVAVLMPREPDLGLGRPSVATAAGQNLQSNAKVDCAGYEKACSTAFGVLDSFQSVAVRGLADVRADIESEQQKAGRNLKRDN
jgi:hypothetical protein